MEKLVNFLKKRYKIMIPLMVVIVLLLTIYFLYREYKYDNYRDKQEVAVTQYFGGVKTEYTAIVTYNLKKKIVDVTALDKKIEYDSTPIYYSDSDQVIFPSEMNMVFPLKDGSQYKIYKYGVYYKEDGVDKIANGEELVEYNDFFLYDGDGLYFFPNSVSLKITGLNEIKLGDMSYISLVGGYTLTYYDKENDESKVIEIEGKTVNIINDDMTINASEAYLETSFKKVLLTSPDNLS